MNLLSRLLTLPFLSLLLFCHAPSALAAPLNLSEDITYASLVDPQGSLTFGQAQQRLKVRLSSSSLLCHEVIRVRLFG